MSVLILFAGCDFLLDMFPDSAGVDSDDDNNTLLGLPSEAQPGKTQLIEHEAYTVLYSYDDLIPVWVSWHLDADDSGNIERSDNFGPDLSVPEKYRVTTGDYTNSGYSRGHLCPNADRDANETLQTQTFYMTNMVPQNQNLNGGDWGALEEYCRDLAAKGYELYIVAGALKGDEGGLKSDGSGRLTEFTSKSGKTITVPEKLWKAVIAITQDDSIDDLERIENGDTRVYATAVLMDNEPLDGTWKNAIVPIDEIERLANLELFSMLPDDLEFDIESAKEQLPAV